MASNKPTLRRSIMQFMSPNTFDIGFGRPP